MHATKVLIFLYTVLCLITPRPPDMVSFIMETIATLAANFAYGFVLMYLWSRPAMQQTVVQPLTMVIVIAMAVLGNKEYLIAVMGNCFPKQLQVKSHWWAADLIRIQMIKIFFPKKNIYPLFHLDNMI